MNAVFCRRSGVVRYCSPHSHDSWEIILNISGSFNLYANGDLYHLGVGDVIVIPPDTVHEEIADDMYTDICLRVNDLDFSDIVTVHDDGTILTLINLIRKVLVEKEYNFAAIADSMTETVYQYIVKLRKTGCRSSAVEQLKNILYANISNSDFRLGDVMRSIGFNEDYIRRCFKREIGKTPLGYLTELRIDQAKVLLTQETFTSIENISAICGFGDSFYFSTCFKKHVGVAPLQYRKMNENNTK